MNLTRHIKVVILVILLLFTVVAPIWSYVISRSGGVIHGVNKYGNYYYLYPKLGYVDYVNTPGNYYYNTFGTSYRFYIPQGTKVPNNVDQTQFVPYIPKVYQPYRYPVQKKNKIPFWTVVHVVCIGFVIVSVIIKIFKDF
ncbi:MAG: hypothetical protein LHW45_08605 [Candidatus Cloacimonetes bacterium]|nr:hypothetical protein [Candidatus Cloacimonadota bacterium]MDY0367670.1 hypothetical protein [Candidatus Syntrophosphaera sp.]